RVPPADEASHWPAKKSHAPFFVNPKCQILNLKFMASVTIQVPATTANLGPGYDCLGVALRIYNRVTVGKGERRKTKGESSMASEAAGKFFDAAAIEPFGFDFEIEGDVPRSRGLG